MTTIARSYLYVPADKPEMLTKAPTRGADALIVDLEDAVALSAKSAARNSFADVLDSGVLDASGVWVRVNGPSVQGGRLLEDDLDVAVARNIAGVIVAKSSSAAEVAAVVASVRQRQKAARPNLGVVALIESAAGLIAAPAIAMVEGVIRLQLGEADFVADLGLDPGEEELELLPARHQVVLTSAAAGLAPPVAPVSTEIRDLSKLRASTERLRRLGFFGRSVVHPAQIAIVHEVFTPSDAGVAEARALVRAFDDSVANGSGTIVDEHGRMVDEAVVRSARRIAALGTRAENAR